MSEKQFEKPNCNKCIYQYNCPCDNSCCNAACLTIYERANNNNKTDKK